MTLDPFLRPLLHDPVIFTALIIMAGVALLITLLLVSKFLGFALGMTSSGHYRRIFWHNLGRGERLAPPSSRGKWDMAYQVARERWYERLRSGKDPGNTPVYFTKRGGFSVEPADIAASPAWKKAKEQVRELRHKGFFDPPGKGPS